MSHLSIPSHDERCYGECTKDVVFLFQWREIHRGGDADIPDGYTISEEGEIYNENGDAVSGKYMADNYPELFYEIWHTDRVYLSREEGEAYGRSRESYAWRDGWRVYGVPSYGLMAELIKGT